MRPLVLCYNISNDDGRQIEYVRRSEKDEEKIPKCTRTRGTYTRLCVPVEVEVFGWNINVRQTVR